MNRWFSPIFMGIWQVGAILLFLLYDDRDAFWRRPQRIGLTTVFAVIHILLQGHLHGYLEASGWGNLPVFQFLAATWCYYAVFVWLWFCPLQVQRPRAMVFAWEGESAESLSWPICCFIALIFLLADNSVWPLISGFSRRIYGINNLYDGNLPVRTLWILVFGLLECVLIRGTRHFLPDLRKIVLDRCNVIQTFASVIPFLCIRLFLGQMQNQENKMFQIAMTVCCLVAIITLTNSVGRSSEQHDELQETRMLHVLQTQQKLFEQKLSDIDMVNRKYHDMKNVLLYLQANSDAKEARGEIERMLSSIRPYESIIKTGHTVIDIILNEKLLLCQEQGITCVPYLDGSLLSFVKPLDLCTLIGNAMDNAIESCSQIPDAQKRQISIHDFVQGACVVLTFRNTFAHRPVLGRGLPVTTKTNLTEHGYGLKNISYIAGQYHGTVNCAVEGDEFVLTLLLCKTKEPEADCLAEKDTCTKDQ